MVGRNGVFNMETGAFREQPRESHLYRDFQVRTFIYEHSEAGSIGVNRQDRTDKISQRVRQVEARNTSHFENIRSRAEFLFTDGIRKFSGQPVTVQQKEIIHEISSVVAGGIIERKQIIPVASKAIAALSGILNQAMIRAPVSSDVSSRLIPPVVIPPPLMRVPVVLANVLPFQAVTQLQVTNILEESVKELLIELEGSSRRWDMETNPSSILDVGSRWTAQEKTTSLITYSTAIESYDIGSYDYSSGEGVSYTVNLHVRDIKIEHFN